MALKRVIATLISVMLMFSICACGVGNGGANGNNGAENSSAENDSGSSDSSGRLETDSDEYRTGTPWIYMDLEGVVKEDTKTDLKDDYALYVNKDAVLELTIPEGYSFGGRDTDVAVKTDEDIRKMFLGDAPKSHDAKLAYDLFWLMMDWDSRNALGVKPLKELTDAVESISSIDDLTAYYTKTPVEKQLYLLWHSGSHQDLLDSSTILQYFLAGNLLLNDSAEYKELSDYGKIRKAAAEEFATKMLVKLGYSEDEAKAKFDNCIAFETILAEAIPTSEEQKKPEFLMSLLNYYTRAELKKAQGDVPILGWLKNAGYPKAKKYWVASPDFITKLKEVYTEDNLELIKDTMIVNGLFSKASLLDRESYEWSTEYSNALSGASGILDDETVMSDYVSSKLEWPVAQLYSERYLKQGDKDRIKAMIDEIKGEYHGIIQDADFLSADTKAKAIEKLDALKGNALFPDDWEAYACKGLDFAAKEDGGTAWDANEAISKYLAAKAVKDYSQPADKSKWRSTPQTVNCFYNPQNNQIYIMGAYAQGDIYNSEMSDEELYAKLGTVIAHEISHAFDPTGAQFDKDGNMADWWTAEDKAAFKERTDRLAAYYNNMHPWEGQDFNGETMTGEACADMAGLKCVLRIVGQKDGFDYDKFFRAYADGYLTKDTLQTAYRRINDTHPMSYLRINATLQQYDEFLDFYDIKEGDNMYLAPEDRVAIW